MFESLSERGGFPFGSFLVHGFLSVVAPPLCVFAALVLTGRALRGIPQTAVTLLMGFLYLAMGLTCGYYVHTFFSGLAAKPGQFAFVIPLLAFAYGFISDCVKFSPASSLHEFFQTERYGDGGIVLIFFTLPVWGSCCYSAGVALAQRREAATAAGVTYV